MSVTTSSGWKEAPDPRCGKIDGDIPRHWGGTPEPSKSKRGSEASICLPSATTRAVGLSVDDLFETGAFHRCTAFPTAGSPSKAVGRGRSWIFDKLWRFPSFCRRHLDATTRA